MLRTLALAAALLTTPLAAAEPQQEIAAVVTDMAGRWAGGNWKTIPQDLWDLSEPQPMYLAEEQAGWLIGWDAIKGYFDPKRGSYQAFDYVASDIQTRLIAKDLAVAVWTIDWQMKMGRGGPMHEKLRANAVLRKTKTGWKFIHYAEAPKSPLVYMQDLYGESVTPAFRARAEEAAKKATQ